MQSTAQQDFTSKVERGLFTPQERFIRYDLEDRRQEGLGHAWRCYQAKRAAGQEMPDPVLAVAFRRRACDLSRQLVLGGRQAQDPLNPRNFHLGQVELLHLDGVIAEAAGTAEEDVEVSLGLAEVLATDPSAVLASALDLDRWLRALPARDRALLAMRAAGHTLAEIANAQETSISPVLARLRRLGAELATRAGVRINKQPCSGRGRAKAQPCAA